MVGSVELIQSGIGPAVNPFSHACYTNRVRHLTDDRLSTVSSLTREEEVEESRIKILIKYDRSTPQILRMLVLRNII